MTHETKIFGDTLDNYLESDAQVDLFTKKHTDIDDDFSEDTTAGGGNYPIEHLINSMKMNPRKKTQIDVNDEEANISVNEYDNEEWDTNKKINYFSKSSFKIAKTEKTHKKSKYRIRNTQRRIFDPQIKAWRKTRPNLLNFQELT